MAKNLARQDKNGARTPTDLERRYNFNNIQLTQEELEFLKASLVTDSSLSITSTNPVENKVVTEALSNKVTKEPGKELSSNDFTDTDKEKVHSHTNKTILDSVTEEMLVNLNLATLASHAHENKAILDKLTQAVIDNSHTHTNKAVLDKITQTMINNWSNTATQTTYNLANYKESGLTILRSSCIKKNKRVAINFVGTMTIAANTTTTLFDLPDDVSPLTTKDFVVFGQTNNNDGYVGYGYITETGSLQVRFNTAISSYIRFSVTYDLD